MNYEQNNGFNNNYNDNNNYNNYNNNGNLNYGYNNPNMMNNNMGNMNNNEKQPLSYHIKRFLIGFLLIALLIFILLWLFPTKQGIKDSMAESLAPLYDRIFAENIDTMKEVAIAYYTTDRLPKKEGDTKKLTLGEMLEMKLLLSIKDKNGEMCDPDDSYVEITKMNKEYKMKVNLSCGDEEDYIVVYLGCYNYCLNDICEKKEVTKSKPKQQSIFQKVTNNIKKIIKPTPTKTQPAKYYCAKVNGKYYNDKGKVVSKASYEKACKSKPAKYYCAVVNGKYYDNKGNSVSKSAYEKACNPQPTKYKYLYKKTVTTERQYSNWSNWSDDIEYDPNNNNINWGKHEFVWYEKNDSATKTLTTTKKVVDKSKPIYQTKKVLIGTYSRWACSGYDYFIDKTTSTTYQVTSGWRYVGTVTTSSIPANTNNVRYDWVDFDFSNCGDICNSSHQYTFKKYVRSTSTTSKVSTSEESLRAVCNNVVKTEIPVYATVNEFLRYDKKLVTETETIYYYHKKTRKLISDEKTNTYTAWSYSKNDEILINQGYKYTGIYEKVES